MQQRFAKSFERMLRITENHKDVLTDRDQRSIDFHFLVTISARSKASHFLENVTRGTDKTVWSEDGMLATSSTVR